MKKTRFVWAAVLVVGIGGATLWHVRPSYRRWSSQRAAALAVECLARTNLANASLSARRALQMDSNCVAACRVMADLSERTRSPRAVYWRQRIRDLEPEAISNHLSLARSAMLFRQPELAKETLAKLDGARQLTNAEYHELSAQIAFAEHDVPRAEDHLLQAAQLSPTNAVFTHNLQIVRLHAVDTNVAAAARAALEKDRGDPIYGAAILRALTREALARRQTDRAAQWSTELQERADSQFEDRLLHLTILQMSGKAEQELTPDNVLPAQGTRLVPPDLTDFIRLTQQEAGADPDRVCAVANWLCEHNLSAAALSWIETLPETTRSATGVRLVETQCNLVLKNWNETAQWLKQGYWAGDEHLRHALLALVYRQQGDTALANLEWRQAVHASHDGRHSVSKSQQALVRLAGAWSWENEAEALLWEIASGPETRWALALLRRAYELAGDTRSLLRVFRAELVWNPGDLIAKNNLTAASLLLGTNLVAAHQAAREVYQLQPTNTAVACTYAYSLHLQGRTAEAIPVLAALPESAKRTPSTAAYYGLMLAAQGADEDADRYFALAQDGALLPEEKKMVAQARLRQGGGTGSQKSEVGSQESGVRGQESVDRGQESGVRSQESAGKTHAEGTGKVGTNRNDRLPPNPRESTRIEGKAGPFP